MQQETKQDIFNTISSPSKGIYKDKGSKFLSFAFPVSDLDEIRQHLDNLKKEYFDARHHCYAYRLGYTGDVWRANDDGEPSSTAGRQILGQLLSKGLCDILVVVVRYFGGIKLGVPGLIKAYRTATSDALEHAEIIEKKAERRLKVLFGYADTHSISRTLKELRINPKKFISEAHCTILVDIGLSEVEDFTEKITKAGGTVLPFQPETEQINLQHG